MGSPRLVKLDTALAGVTALGFDTAPFIYFIERHPAYGPLVREIFRRLDVGVFSGYSSVITFRSYAVEGGAVIAEPRLGKQETRETLDIEGPASTA